MRAIGRWSIASVLKVLVDVPYFAGLVLLPLLVTTTLWMTLRSDGAASQRFEVPVQFELEPAAHPVSITDSRVESATITNAQGTLSVSGRFGVFTVVAALGGAVLLLGTALLILHRLRAILRTLKDEDPFAHQNPGRIRTIGWAIVLGQLASAGLVGWLAWRVTGGLAVTGVTFRSGLQVQGWAIFTGMVVLMLAEVFRLGAQMKGDLETARRIQFDLVPSEVFQRDGLAVLSRMKPAKTVGGDCYDVRALDDRTVALVVADVMGKGLPAALLMTSVLGSLRALLYAGLRGTELMSALNRHVCAHSGGRLVTLFYGELDVATGCLAYVNAGHNPPLLARADGIVDRLPATTLLLGVSEDCRVEAGQAQIGPADRLLVFTDGLSEAMNRREEQYGEERLTALLRQTRSLATAAAVDNLLADVQGFCAGAAQHDDMTLMLVAR